MYSQSYEKSLMTWWESERFSVHFKFWTCFDDILRNLYAFCTAKVMTTEQILQCKPEQIFLREHLILRTNIMRHYHQQSYHFKNTNLENVCNLSQKSSGRSTGKNALTLDHKVKKDPTKIWFFKIFSPFFYSYF